MTALPNLSEKYSREAFIQLALSAGALKFGKFTLKSGRESPYFFNAGMFYHGHTLKALGCFYADLLIRHKIECQHLFGPAYKGLPLATATSIALAEQGVTSTVTFNRKEAKTHGEGGQLIGAPLTGNTVMIDDVITAGTAFRESEIYIRENGGTLTTVVIALDRCERGQHDLSTLKEIESRGIQVLSVINFHDLTAYLEKAGDVEALGKLRDYHREYGV